MDSLHSLNRSLPSSTTAPPPKPPEAVLQAFRDAALSVTKLYKEASSSQQRERQAGYQEALDDLLAFLDKENLGLGDGEGWRVRRWATERLDGGTGMGNDGSESEEEERESNKGQGDKTERREVPESSPAPQSQPQDIPTAEPISQPQPQPFTLPKADAFSFRSDLAYPREVEMNTQDSTSAPSSPAEVHISHTPQPAQIAARSRRRGQHGNNASHRHGHRNTAARALGPGVGSKRKFHFGDFFDLGNFNPDGKDGFGGAGGLGGGGGGGGKRGRTS